MSRKRPEGSGEEQSSDRATARAIRTGKLCEARHVEACFVTERLREEPRPNSRANLARSQTRLGGHQGQLLLHPLERFRQVQPSQVEHGAVVARDLPPQDFEPAVLASPDRSERGGAGGCEIWGGVRE